MLELLLPSPFLRAAFAAGTALVTVAFLIPWLAEAARRRHYGDRDDKSDSDTLNELHKQKRRTRATIAKEKGLEPLALRFVVEHDRSDGRAVEPAVRVQDPLPPPPHELIPDRRRLQRHRAGL